MGGITKGENIFRRIGSFKNKYLTVIQLQTIQMQKMRK